MSESSQQHSALISLGPCQPSVLMLHSFATHMRPCTGRCGLGHMTGKRETLACCVRSETNADSTGGSKYCGCIRYVVNGGCVTRDPCRPDAVSSRLEVTARDEYGRLPLRPGGRTPGSFHRGCPLHRQGGPFRRRPVLGIQRAAGRAQGTEKRDSVPPMSVDMPRRYIHGPRHGALGPLSPGRAATVRRGYTHTKARNARAYFG